MWGLLLEQLRALRKYKFLWNGAKLSYTSGGTIYEKSTEKMESNQSRKTNCYWSNNWYHPGCNGSASCKANCHFRLIICRCVKSDSTHFGPLLGYVGHRG